DARAYAIVAGAQRFFASLGVWDAMAAAAEPIRRMEITDSSLEEIVRPLLLDFTPRPDQPDTFAAMVPNGIILSALLEKARESDIALLPTEITGTRPDGARRIADTATGPLRTRLLVAADGRGSRLRSAAGIAYYGWPYHQTAIVGTISHSLPHEGVAVQHFLPSGPFALLPLPGNRSSIVWSEAPDIAQRILALDPDDLVAEVDRRAAGRHGIVTAIEGASAFPLSLGIARSFVGERLALLGDAAHGYHPLAGQGLNYGLRGAAALAEAIMDAARLGLDIGSDTALGPYETGRRPDALAMAAATETLNRLFSTDLAPVRAIRDLGLGLVNRLPAMKQRLLAEAAGGSPLAPRAFRGEAI
ncbi:MAG: FAD-dependent monooxygenase, partial [Proteobacteria bacterium]|nr:FAD-dependent monooxygenase [Pseudomonadota bacterium]